MYHIKNEVISEIEIKKSKFFGILSPASSIEEAREILSDVRKRYPNATHYCTAMIFGNIQRSNDDGEPSGTAGLPMLECLRHKELDNVVMIVVRYFGGTLLGTGGLVKAYQQSTLSAMTAICPRLRTTISSWPIFARVCLRSLISTRSCALVFFSFV